MSWSYVTLVMVLFLSGGSGWVWDAVVMVPEVMVVAVVVVEIVAVWW